MRLRNAALAAAAACLLSTLAACGGSGTQANAGDVIPARDAQQFASAKKSMLATPIGTLQIHTGAPVTQIPAGDTRELAAQQAPAGLTFLPITWKYDTASAKIYARYVMASTVPVVDLHVGDGSYRLPTPDPAQGAESFYVLVNASDAHPKLDLDYDGVTQTVDLSTGARQAGRASGLYKLIGAKTPKPRSCPTAPAWKEVAQSAGSCKFTGPLLLPYVAGRWAEPGHEWLVVSVATTLTTYTQAGVNLTQGGVYYPLGLKSTYRLGNARPVQVISSADANAACPVPSTGACNSDAALVFDSGTRSRQLTLLQRYTLKLTSGWGGYAGPKQQMQTGTTVITLPGAKA